MDKQALVFASSNQGKIKELHDLLTPLGFDVRSQGEFDIEAVDETAHTFVENALLKARNACRVSGLPAIADDSGLEVDALHGAPGLYSARYAQMHNEGAGDADNNRYLLKQLEHLNNDSDRKARFKSVVVYLKHPTDPSPIIAEGQWEGHILRSPKGEGGFGYDPVFYNHDTRQAAALLDKQTKNRLSHRGKAVARLIQLLSVQQ